MCGFQKSQNVPDADVLAVCVLSVGVILFYFFTSVVVLDITAGRFHGGVTAGAPPAQLAHTVPAIVTQSAPTISIAQAGAALCVCV